MTQERIVFPCGKIKLEGIFYKVERTGTVPAVVVCHPHPLFGGSMHNNVTYAIAGALASVSIAALLFNFRGVGRSEGEYGGGLAEQEDVAAALQWLQTQGTVNPDQLALAGYSFGAAVAFPAACADMRVKGVALISPYFEQAHIPLLKNCTKPKLIVSGANDEVVAADDARQYYAMAAEPREFALIEGADHFWGGYESRMADVTARFIKGLFI
ncbi:MAG: alpha/beta hydrolase [Dehalococcoidia bacterium]|nr:alpha/beta hydrolase [Dehalococcoidia bacterium]